MMVVIAMLVMLMLLQMAMKLIVMGENGGNNIGNAVVIRAVRTSRGSAMRSNYRKRSPVCTGNGIYTVYLKLGDGAKAAAKGGNLCPAEVGGGSSSSAAGAVGRGLTHKSGGRGAGPRAADGLDRA